MDVNELANIVLELKREFRAKAKTVFLSEIESLIGEDEDVQEILFKPYRSSRKVAVTFDKVKLGPNSIYTNFDLLLVLIDRISGGTGIRKPINQLRVIQWNGTRRSLLRTLTYFRRLHPALKVKSLLILPYPIPSPGYKLNSHIYKK